MKKPTTLRKGRYIQFRDNKNIYISKIVNSSIILKKQVNFDIFNIPVECIEIDKTLLEIHQSGNKSILINHKPHICILDDNKLYIPVSQISFVMAKPLTQLYRKLRSM